VLQSHKGRHPRETVYVNFYSKLEISGGKVKKTGVCLKCMAPFPNIIYYPLEKN
jgi:hypothetical protein